MFLAVVSVNQESASGQVNRSTWVIWFIFMFGMGSYIVVTVVALIRNYMLMHPPCTPFSVIYSYTHYLTLHVLKEKVNHLF